MGKGKNSLRTE